MRALHLVGLRDVRGERIAFRPASGEPLFIPCLVPKTDQEIVLAFCQHALEPEVIPRIEVDFFKGLVPADREFLRRNGTVRPALRPFSW
jgi:hypothetical protein